MRLQIFLGPNPLSRVPAAPLIDAEDRHELAWRLNCLTADKILDIGLLPMPPQVLKLLGWS
jgi:hypothetical protein